MIEETIIIKELLINLINRIVLILLQKNNNKKMGSLILPIFISGIIKKWGA